MLLRRRAIRLGIVRQGRSQLDLEYSYQAMGITAPFPSSNGQETSHPVPKKRLSSPQHRDHVEAPESLQPMVRCHRRNSRRSSLRIRHQFHVCHHRHRSIQRLLQQPSRSHPGSHKRRSSRRIGRWLPHGRPNFRLLRKTQRYRHCLRTMADRHGCAGCSHQCWDVNRRSYLERHHGRNHKLSSASVPCGNREAREARCFDHHSAACHWYERPH